MFLPFAGKLIPSSILFFVFVTLTKFWGENSCPRDSPQVTAIFDIFLCTSENATKEEGRKLTKAVAQGFLSRFHLLTTYWCGLSLSSTYGSWCCSQRERESEIILYLRLMTFHCWICSRAIYHVRYRVTLDENG